MINSKIEREWNNMHSEKGRKSRERNKIREKASKILMRKKDIFIVDFLWEVGGGRSNREYPPKALLWERYIKRV